MSFMFSPRSFTREGYRQIVTDMWAQGASQRQIAAHIGKSKNAVAGMIRDFKLPKKTEGRGVPRGWTAKRINDAKPKPKPVIPSPDPIGPLNDFPERGTCQFSYGNPGTGEDWRMCGHPGTPWCEHHASRVFMARKTGVTA